MTWLCSDEPPLDRPPTTYSTATSVGIIVAYVLHSLIFNGTSMGASLSHLLPSPLRKKEYRILMWGLVRSASYALGDAYLVLY
jgi:hypothetical protein